MTSSSVIRPDICILGGGPGGLSVAAGTAQLGLRTVLLEPGAMGGDCLNVGCVPSKSLLAAGHAAQAIRRAACFGIDATLQAIDGQRVHDFIHSVIAAIAPHDSVERFETLGVTVLRHPGRFVAPDAVIAGSSRIEAGRFVIATGARPLIPPIPGLAGTPFLTHESVFDLTAVPSHLIVIGGGPVGAELAQAYQRLGAPVTLLEAGRMLARDDPEMVAILRRQLLAEGMVIHEGTTVENVARRGDEWIVTAQANGVGREVTGSHLLIAAGRRPNLSGLGLEEAAVGHSARGIEVDRRLRTSNRRIYAIGDAVGAYPFTHIAAYHASIVIRNVAFRLPWRVDTRGLPWVTYTDPEVAQVGLSEQQAKEAGIAHRVLRAPFAENDRARTEARAEGMAKVIATPRGHVLGAGIVGPSAGELILPWALAIRHRLKIGALATVVAPYPTFSEISKAVAGSFFTDLLFSERTRRLVRWLSRLP